MERIYNKVLCVDGSYMIHRNLHVPEVFNLMNSKGERTGGIFGFLKTLRHEMNVCGDYFPIITFDSGLADRRTKADPNYKRALDRANDNTVLTPEEAESDYVTQYHRQRNKLIELLSYMGIPSLKFQGWEGDDLMYILSNMTENGLVLTDDRDMLQLLNENCSVRRPMAEELWTTSTFIESKGYSNIYDFVIFKAVKGDGSDNIPGSCKGVGDASINDFIKLLNIFRCDNGWDFTGYPSDEKSMKEFCKNHNIKYKKAYCNFDQERFIINMELVDLSKVEVPEDIHRSIVSIVDNCRSSVNYFKAIKMLADLEIKDFSVDDMIQLVSVRYKNLMRG